MNVYWWSCLAAYFVVGMILGCSIVALTHDGGAAKWKRLALFLIVAVGWGPYALIVGILGILR